MSKSTFVSKLQTPTIHFINFSAVSFVIQLGSVSLSSTDVNRVTVPATTSVVHPDFNNETFVNNIGLINLPDDLRLNGKH